MQTVITYQLSYPVGANTHAEYCRACADSGEVKGLGPVSHGEHRGVCARCMTLVRDAQRVAAERYDVDTYAMLTEAREGERDAAEVLRIAAKAATQRPVWLTRTGAITGEDMRYLQQALLARGDRDGARQVWLSTFDSEPGARDMRAKAQAMIAELRATSGAA